MSGKSIRDIKLRGFPAIAAIVISTLMLLGVWSFLGRFFSTESELTSEALSQSSGKLAESLARPSGVDVSKATLGSAQNPPQNKSQNKSQNLVSNPARQGFLRVANSSDHPVRVALLLRKTGQSKDVVKVGESYEAPAHWDFAPGEGRTKGLILSLPNRALKVRQGDVLVAFAQDGSRRYWGPYVVGETVIPNWNSSPTEWQLVLDP